MEEFGGMDLGLDSVQSGEGGAEVTAEAMERVRESQKKSGQMRGQIAQAGKQQKQFAQLLIVLLQHIVDEQLVGQIFRQLADQKVPIPAIFAEFLPFVIDYVKLQVSSGPFVHLLPASREMEPSVEGVTSWMMLVRKTFPYLQKLPDKQFVSLIIDCCRVYEYIDVERLSESKYEELKTLLLKEIGS